MTAVSAAVREAEFVNRRAAERFGLHLPIRIGVAGGAAIEAVLVDVSTGGFRLRADLPVGAGAAVWMRMAGQLPVGARLVWSNDGVHGGAFDAPLSAGQMRRLVELGRTELAEPPERSPGLVDLLRRTREGLGV